MRRWGGGAIALELLRVMLFLQCALRRPGAALKVCVQEGCGKHASYGALDTRRRTACALHKAAHHVYLIGALCEFDNGTAEHCQRRGSYGFRGGALLRLCRTHRRPGMVHVQSRVCLASGCAKQPIFGVANTTRPLYCRQHKGEAHVDVVNRRCKLCSRQGVFGDPLAGHIYTHIHIYTYIYVCIYTSICIHLYVYEYVYMCVCIHVCVCVSVCVCV
jgi:hypothetical protein